MRALLQRVTRAAVTVAERVTGQIAGGFVVLLGVTHSDSMAEAKLLAEKTAYLRVFADEAGKMNRSLLDTGGGALVISQFTLFADAKRGRRPDFMAAARPEQAAPLVDAYIAALCAAGVRDVQTGVFGAHMTVELVNDGPVTIMLDTAEW
ncbi:MAG: D-tyrosyl-tRNA(Tyr) deacylase [Chloroflexi bacterium]|nr:D-tyrosyl-tRNA(Tyr) deacylase [Chloroflexota bacterium]